MLGLIKQALHTDGQRRPFLLILFVRYEDARNVMRPIVYEIQNRLSEKHSYW